MLVRGQDSFHLSEVVTDSLYQSKQKIYLLSIKNYSRYSVDIGYNTSRLVKTSEIAKNNNALAAINGSFFDIENGGSTTYLEKNDKVISKTQKPNSLINGLIVLSKDGHIEIDQFISDRFYKKSKKEKFAIATGPLLIKDSIPQKLPNKSFTSARHPRTCLCKREDDIVFIVVDGRHKEANGMSLFEAQKYLLSLGCIAAINLDGGGSSTMWTKKRGIINTPSDSNIEREVSNALLLIDNK